MTAWIEAVHRPSRPARRGRLARQVLLSCLASLVVGLIFGNILIDYQAPVAIDAEYALRRERLRAQLANDPERPTLLVVGSSRVVQGFVPEELPTLTTGDGQIVVPFNMAHIGAGPTMNRVVVERIYRDGFRPRGVIIELMPTFLTRESNSLISAYLYGSDLDVAGRSVNTADLYWKFSRRRVTAFPQLARIACGVDEPVLECGRPGPLGGPVDLRSEISDEDRARKTAHQVRFNYVCDAHVTAGRERAIREAVARCRQNGAEVRFLLTPEGPAFRAAFADGCREAFEAFVERLAADLAVEVIDARDWLDDADFTDSHHPLAGGARKFTLRLGREVFVPWTAGWSRSGDESR